MPILLAGKQLATPLPPVTLPIWTGTPAPSFTQGTALNYSFASFVTGGTSFASINNALPTGVTLNSGTQQLVYDGVGAATSVTGIVIRATNANGSVDSNAFGFSIAAGSGGAFDFFISTTGSDSNPGTLAAPWAITAINTKQATAAGKRIGMLPGIYNIQALAAASGSGANGYQTVTLKINGGPSASTPTYLASCDASGNYLPANPSAADGAKCGAIITCKVGSVYGNPNNNNGGGTARAGNPMLGFWQQGGLPTNAANVTVDAIGFTGNISGNVIFGQAGNTPTPGIIIQNCEFFDNSGVGSEPFDNLCFMSGVLGAGSALLNNYWHDAVGYSISGMDHLSAFLLWPPSTAVLIQNNTVRNCGSIFNKSQAGFNSEGHTVELNYVDVSMFTSGLLAALQDFGSTVTLGTTVRGNIAIGTQTMALYKAEGGTGTGPLIYHSNTCIITNGPDRCGPASCNSGPTTIYNNLIWNNSGTSMSEGYQMPLLAGLSQLDYNGYFKGASADKFESWLANPSGPFTGYATLAAWQGATAADAHAISNIVSPLFTGTGTAAQHYQLQVTSAAKNAGRVGGVSAGAVTDMGAWGYANLIGKTIGCSFAP